MIRSVREVAFVVYVVGGDHRLSSGLIGVGQGVERKKNGGDCYCICIDKVSWP